MHTSAQKGLRVKRPTARGKQAEPEAAESSLKVKEDMFLTLFPWDSDRHPKPLFPGSYPMPATSVRRKPGNLRIVGVQVMQGLELSPGPGPIE